VPRPASVPDFSRRKRARGPRPRRPCFDRAQARCARPAEYGGIGRPRRGRGGPPASGPPRVVRAGGALRPPREYARGLPAPSLSGRPPRYTSPPLRASAAALPLPRSPPSRGLERGRGRRASALNRPGPRRSCSRPWLRGGGVRPRCGQPAPSLASLAPGRRAARPASHSLGRPLRPARNTLPAVAAARSARFHGSPLLLAPAASVALIGPARRSRWVSLVLVARGGQWPRAAKTNAWGCLHGPASCFSSSVSLRCLACAGACSRSRSPCRGPLGRAGARPCAGCQVKSFIKSAYNILYPQTLWLGPRRDVGSTLTASP